MCVCVCVYTNACALHVPRASNKTLHTGTTARPTPHTHTHTHTHTTPHKHTHQHHTHTHLTHKHTHQHHTHTHTHVHTGQSKTRSGIRLAREVVRHQLFCLAETTYDLKQQQQSTFYRYNPKTHIRQAPEASNQICLERQAAKRQHRSGMRTNSTGRCKQEAPAGTSGTESSGTTRSRGFHCQCQQLQHVCVCLVTATLSRTITGRNVHVLLLNVVTISFLFITDNSGK